MIKLLLFTNTLQTKRAISGRLVAKDSAGIGPYAGKEEDPAAPRAVVRGAAGCLLRRRAGWSSNCCAHV